MRLPTRPLGTSGLENTTVGFGAWAIGGGGWAFGWGPQDHAASLATMQPALELGVNWVDTAAVDGLGHSEERVVEPPPRGGREGRAETGAAGNRRAGSPRIAPEARHRSSTHLSPALCPLR